MNYLRRRSTWNIQISPLTKITKLMPVSYLFPFISACCERNGISWERRIFKIVQVYEHYDGANKMQIEQHWVIPQTVSYSVQRNWKQQVLRRNNRTWKRLRLNYGVTKEMKDSRLNAIECLKTDYVRKGRLDFSCKSTTAANVDLTESLLNNWLKNNHITVDKIYYLRSLFVFFYEV